MRYRVGRIAVVVGIIVAFASTSASAPAQTQPAAPECRPDGPPIELSGSLTTDDVNNYRELPVAVTAGTTRIEIGYSWHSNGADTATDKTVVDLGLWDQRGPHDPAAFRGWSGSRQGKVAEGQAPVFVQADKAERGYVPGPIEPGTWSVELGFGAVQTDGATWSVSVRCLAATVGAAWMPDFVDPSFVARDTPAWYRADLHLHAYHSNDKGPDPATMIEFARKAKLDIVPVTEYVTDVQWGELGPAQRANPDLLVWPGREVITYFGHAIVLGETPSSLDYRQGFEGVDIRAIQRGAVDDGAVFQVAHPTIFPGEALAAFCRGCEFRLGDHIDWDLVDTIEVVTGPAIVDPATLDRPEPGKDGIPNPFVGTAIDLWESLLQQGHRITAVSGSDDKLGPDYGQTATMIHAERLSRAAVVDALRAGHAYVQSLGADASPTLDLDARTADGAHGTFGDTVIGRSAQLDVTVHGGEGQTVVVSRNGTEVQRIPIIGDPFTTTIDATRDTGEGPLGTFWRVDVANDVALTAIGNPVFLADALPRAKQRGAVPTAAPVVPNFPQAPPPPAGSPATGGSGTSSSAGMIIAIVVALLVVAAIAIALRRRRRA